MLLVYDAFYYKTRLWALVRRGRRRRGRSKVTSYPILHCSLLVERIVGLLLEMIYPPGWLGSCLMVTILSQITLAHPLSLGTWHNGNSTLLSERADASFLRILPLGGSVTLGWGSSTGNGYVTPQIASAR